MYQRGDQVNRCVQFSFIEMSKEAEIGLLCQNLSFPGSYFVTMEASPCPDRNWFFSSRRQFQAYSAEIWMINTEQRPIHGEPGLGRPNLGRPNLGRPNLGRPHNGRPNIGRPHIGSPDLGRPNNGRPNNGRPNNGGRR